MQGRHFSAFEQMGWRRGIFFLNRDFWDRWDFMISFYHMNQKNHSLGKKTRPHIRTAGQKHDNSRIPQQRSGFHSLLITRKLRNSHHHPSSKNHPLENNLYDFKQIVLFIEIKNVTFGAISQDNSGFGK
jgi:hypothetical protein